MSILQISPRRTYLIAKRDFLGYVKTWGFWLTALGPFLGIVFGVMAPFVLAKSEPAHYVTILDETGVHKQAIETLLKDEDTRMLETALRETAKVTVPRAERDEFEKILKEEGVDAARAFIAKTSPRLTKIMTVPSGKILFVEPPARENEILKAYVTGEKTMMIDGAERKLSGVLHIFEDAGVVKAEFWSTSPIPSPVIGLTNRYFSGLAQDKYLEGAGLSREDLRNVRKNALRVTSFNPAKTADSKDGQKASLKDRIPYLVAAALSMMLWFTVFTGAYMLLVSMVEEKINKVLEMLLASTRFSEIFFGKLLGVAALTLASLVPWIVLGVLGFYGAMQFGDGVLVEGLTKAITPKMLVFLPVFFALGYVFYGSIFIALGSLAESMQDASTLMTPMVLLLTACVMVVPVGIAYPDSDILQLAAFIPFSAPFAAIIRLPANPPLWETMGSAFILILATVFVVFISSRLFQHGVLSGGGVSSLKTGIRRLFSRTKSRR